MSAATPDPANLITQSVIDEMADLMGADAYLRMLDTLVNDAHSDLSVLVVALQQNDWHLIVAQAHKVKGAAGLLGLTGLQTICKTIGDQAKLNQKAADIEDELQRVASGNVAGLRQSLR